jgi:peptidoglycan hydrolase CwlO-like protein
MVSRLDAIERAVEHFDSTLETQLEAVNARLEDVWESEEQLSHLADIQDKMDQLTAAQANQTQALDGLRRTLGWLAGLIVVAAIGAVVAAGQFL